MNRSSYLAALAGALAAGQLPQQKRQPMLRKQICTRCKNEFQPNKHTALSICGACLPRKRKK